MPKYLVNFKQIPVSLTLSSVDNFSFLGGVQHGSMFQRMFQDEKGITIGKTITNVFF